MQNHKYIKENNTEANTKFSYASHSFPMLIHIKAFVIFSGLCPQKIPKESGGKETECTVTTKVRFIMKV